jgi:hypothetical protein
MSVRQFGIDRQLGDGEGLYSEGEGYFLLRRKRKMQGAPKKTSGRSFFSGAPRCAPLRLF